MGSHGLSVLFRKVHGMSERRFRHIPGGRVAGRCGALLEQIAGDHGWKIVATEVMPDHVHP